MKHSSHQSLLPDISLFSLSLRPTGAGEGDSPQANKHRTYIKEFCALWYKKSRPETGMGGGIFQTQQESQCDWPKLSERRQDQKIGWPKTDHKGPCRL